MKRLVLGAAAAMLSCSYVTLAVGGPSAAGANTGATPVAGGRLIRTSLPPHVRPVRGVADDASSNWSGYAQETSAPGTFTGVSDTFVVPTVDTSTKGTQYVADWVGIGGYNDSTLVQTGIQAVVQTRRGDRVVTYDAWTEIIPAAEKPLALTILPGDTVTASVLETSTNEWKMEVDDVTSGHHAAVSVAYDSSGESAEAINERPCIKEPCRTRDLARLAQTSDITFSPGWFSVAPAGQVPVEQPLLDPADDPATVISLVDIVMTNNSDTAAIATPSSPNSAGDGFAVADGAVAPPPPSV